MTLPFTLDCKAFDAARLSTAMVLAPPVIVVEASSPCGPLGPTRERRYSEIVPAFPASIQIS